MLKKRGSRKPGSVLTAIALSGLPESIGRATHFLLGLAPNGVCRASPCYQGERWALTPPFHPYPKIGRSVFCGTFHRLSASSRRRHSALWCPDFPPKKGGCPLPLNTYIITILKLSRGKRVL